MTLDTIDATYHAGANPSDAFEYVSGLGFTRRNLQELDDTDRERALGALRAVIDAHYRAGRGVTFDSSSWLITARRSG